MASVYANQTAASAPTDNQSGTDDNKHEVKDDGKPLPSKGLLAFQPISQLLSRKSRRRGKKYLKIRAKFKDWLLANKRMIIIYFTISFIAVPAILTSMGAIVEQVIYGKTNAPGYHVKSLAYMSPITAFLIFVRFLWPRDHTIKMDFIIYVMSLSGFIITLSISVISGETLFYTSEHIQTIFGNNYSAIETKQSVYDWLESALVRVFEDQKDKTVESTNSFFRLLPGRVALFGPVRLKQSRSKTKPCASLLHELNLPGLDSGSTKCYSPYDIDNADTATYGDLNFTYFNPTYLNYAGDNISAHDITTNGIFSTYPLSGFWVVWPPNQDWTTVLLMLTQMEANNWIDDHTREISLDFSIMMLDLSHVVVANVFYIVETAPSGRFLGRNARISFNHYAEKLSTVGKVNNDCGGNVDLEEEFFEYAYYGIMPFITYAVCALVLELCRDWRKPLKRLYTYLELSWVVVSFMAIAYRWRAIYFGHCNLLEYTQEIWSTGDTYPVEFFELKAISDYWLLSRQALFVAFFLIMINFLKFVTRLQSLGTLTKTIERSFLELASFGFSFSVVFFAFVTLFYFMFSADSKDYQSVRRSIVTLWTAMLGDIQVTESMHLNRSWAIPLLILFTFTFIFVLLTVIIAIISNAHEQVRSERATQSDSDGSRPAVFSVSAMLSKFRRRKCESPKTIAHDGVVMTENDDNLSRIQNQPTN